MAITVMFSVKMLSKGKIQLPILQHQNYTIDYEIIQKRINQKNIILRVKNGRLIVSAPKYATIQQIESTVKKHIEWVINKLKQYVKTHESESPEKAIQTIYFHGKQFQLVISHDTHKLMNSTDSIFISNTDCKIYVYLNPEPHLESNELNSYINHAVFQKLFSCAALNIPNVVMELGKFFNLMPKRVVVKEQKSRWGSCSTNGSIYMNWRLIQAPEEVLRYVAIHELAHLREHNHSKRFWHLVESMMPTFREQRGWLKENGNKLFLLHAEATSK